MAIGVIIQGPYSDRFNPVRVSFPAEKDHR